MGVKCRGKCAGVPSASLFHLPFPCAALRNRACNSATIPHALLKAGLEGVMRNIRHYCEEHGPTIAIWMAYAGAWFGTIMIAVAFAKFT